MPRVIPIKPSCIQLHRRLCALLGCQGDDLRLLTTPEGLVELRLLRPDIRLPSASVIRIGTEEELEAWARNPMHRSRRRLTALTTSQRRPSRT